MEMMFEIASRITEQVSQKRIRANIWEGSRFEALKDFTCDEIGEWGENLIHRVMDLDPEVEVKHGDVVFFPGWLSHKSQPNKSLQRRIVMGMNWHCALERPQQTDNNHITRQDV